ncbi:hypothetical protein NQ317_007639 [Molorchus minor]|uniref:RRM domain-containing protein n=1 Tax=Molorchus minor TaxID=1323400 RepID=A0ABQ9JAZ0_9CUCU|nr:hypothetical protein NQ317_007639 [Molorchus minor]
MVKLPLKSKENPKKAINAQSRGVIYIGHIPHGFYENEMKSYFKQFGVVTNVKVCRSRKNGNSKGYGYIEFLHPDVAKVAAETMNNYLMFKKRIVAEYVPFEKRPKGLFKGKSSTPTHFSSKLRRDKQIAANIEVDTNKHLARSKSRLSRLSKKMQKLAKDSKDDEITHTYEADPFDSDIEIKIPLKKSRKSVKLSVSKS